MFDKTEVIQEKKYRMNLKQSAKGDWYGEFTVRSDDFNEVKELAKYCKTEIENLIKYRGELDETGRKKEVSEMPKM